MELKNPLEARGRHHGLRLFTGTVEAGDNLHAPAILALVKSLVQKIL
jgi:hypothetical protein